MIKTGNILVVNQAHGKTKLNGQINSQWKKKQSYLYNSTTRHRKDDDDDDNDDDDRS